MQQFAEALFNLTNVVGDVRKGSEDLLNSTPTEQLVVNLVQCLTFQCPDANVQGVVRSMSAVVLRRKLTGGLEPVHTKLPMEAQSQIKVGLLQALVGEESHNIGSKLCDTVVELASVALQDSQWGELLPFLGQSASATNDTLRLYAYWIIGRLIEIAPSTFIVPVETMESLFNAGLTHGNAAIQVAASQAYAAAMVHTPFYKQAGMAVGASVLKVLEACLHRHNETHVEDVLRALVDVMQSRPGFLGPSLPLSLQQMEALCRDADRGEMVRTLAFEFIVSAIEGQPGEGRGVPEAIRLAMTLMLEVEEDEAWVSHDTNYDTGEDVLLETGQIGLGSLGAVAPGPVLLPVLSACMSEFAARPDWKARHAALLAIVQTGEHLEESHMAQLVPWILSSLQDPSPRVRWAAAQACSQVCTEHGKWLVEHLQLMPVLLGRLKDVPRVVSWVLAAIRDLCEVMSAEALGPHLGLILSECLLVLQGGAWFLQEKALQVVSWVADSVDEAFAPYYPAFEQVLFHLIQHPTKNRESVRGRALESLTSVGRALGRTAFRPAAGKLMDATLGVAQGMVKGRFPEGWSGYFTLNAWRRTASVLEEEIGPWLPQLMPALLAVCGCDVGANDGEEEGQWVTDAKGRRRCVNPTLLEDQGAACNTLQELAEHVPQQFGPWLASTLEAMSGILCADLDADLQEAAVACLRQLESCVEHQSTVEEKVKLVVALEEVLLRAVASTNKQEVLVEGVEGIGQLLAQSEVVLPAEFARSLAQQVLSLLEGSSQRMQENAQRRADDALDEEEADGLKDWEEALMVRVIGCVGTLLQTQESLRPFLESCLPLLWNDLSLNSEQLRWLVAIGVLVEILKVVSGPAFEPLQGVYFNHLLESCHPGGFFTPTRSFEVRKAALEGVGVCASHGGAAFHPHVPASVALCTAILATEMANEDDAHELGIRDRAASTLAEICKHHRDKVPKFMEVLSLWMDWLPITTLEECAETCHMVMCELVRDGPLGPASPLFPRVLSVIGQLDPEEEEYSEGLTQLLAAVVRQAKALPPDQLRKFMGGLDKSERRSLEAWGQQA
uniref:TOG domain-containing protein n=1 Tax=Eutreptiella gymnastica TaxID=73025 RepID=A0A7S1HYY3_9EUGL|mmetsp:Transcript_115868/g.201600  ORF Transcript_115868/g.201600 Transcript_115868/m.201600 type:complete len:1067 (+) Transcript_115868:74-3274(+)